MVGVEVCFESVALCIRGLLFTAAMNGGPAHHEIRPVARFPVVQAARTCAVMVIFR